MVVPGMSEAIVIDVSASNSIPVCDDEYSVEIVSEPSDIRNLASSVSHLTGSNGVRSNPEFFLATLWDHWEPRVVVIRRRGHTLGVVYAKVRKLFGVPTGLVYIDSGSSSSVFSRGAHTGNILTLACNALLRKAGVRGLRLTLLAGSPELHAVRADLACQRLDYDEDDLTRHRVLRLAPTYEAFLASIGLKTRRHIRYYRRRTETDSYTYVEGLTVDEFASAASKLMHEEVTGTNIDRAKRARAIAESATAPLLVGLRAPDGEWVSVLAGWREGGRAFVFWQVNSDKRHAHYSPSVVVRSYLIESLIASGVRELVFWGGLEGRLKPHTVPVSSVYLYLDKPDFVWRTIRLFVCQLDRVLPSRMKESFSWVVSPRLSNWERLKHPLVTGSSKPGEDVRLTARR